MAKRRSPEDQAAYLLRGKVALGKPRHELKGERHDGKLHSKRTLENIRGSLIQFARWCNEHHRVSAHRASAELREQWIRERAANVVDKALATDKRALWYAFGRQPGAGVRSTKEAPTRGNRAYTTEQVRAIAERQSPRNALATEIAAAAGLRAHELLTLRRADERPASTRREWDEGRFTGRSGEVYTVQGKNGLVREVMLSRELAERLEQRRLPEPIIAESQRVRYEKYYDVGGGNAWSSSFSAASKSVLGFSLGAHGCRYTYAQDRERDLARLMPLAEAKPLLSQELGHFRPQITEHYLRPGRGR